MDVSDRAGMSHCATSGRARVYPQGPGLVDNLQRPGLAQPTQRLRERPPLRGETVPTKCGSCRPLGAIPIAIESACASNPTKEVIGFLTVCLL